MVFLTKTEVHVTKANNGDRQNQMKMSQLDQTAPEFSE